MPQLFRGAVHRIMTGRREPVTPPAQQAPDRPHSFGSLRRAELDRRGCEAWELPDGTIRHLARSGGTWVPGPAGDPDR